MQLEAKILNVDDRPTKAEARRPFNTPQLAFALILLVAGAIFLARTISVTQMWIYIVAGVLGLALYQAHYGFTSSWRHFIEARKSDGIRAQMLLFLIVNILYLPLLIHGSFLGHKVGGYVSPVGLSLVVGAFLFGVGMQIADGCASGTLYHTGGGDPRGVLTVVGFVVGSLLGTINFTWWMNTPHLQPISFLQTFGYAGGFAFNVLLMAIVFIVVAVMERRRYGKLAPLTGEGFSLKTIFRGPWSWIGGSIVLALGNAAILILSGKPWGVTSAFALWGGKIAQGVGIPVTNWGYWQTKANVAALHGNIFHDVTTVADIGVMLGALLAAGLAGGFPKRYFRRFPARMVLAAILGGVVMGYGARIAFGCNIGAYFSGVASFSLHGWAWAVFAFIGSLIGVKLRPWFAYSSK